MTCVDVRDLERRRRRSPGTRGSPSATLIATRARRCGAPGREADVGVLGLAGGWVERARRGARCRARALGPPRLGSRRRRERPSGTRRTAVMSAATSRPRRGSSSRRRARPRTRGSRPSRSTGRCPGMRPAPAPDQERHARERHRLRRPDIRSMSCSPAIAAITEPAAMNISALKKACVIRWNMPALYAAIETPDDHVADLADRRVGDDPLEVGCDQRDRSGEEQRERADRGGDVGRRRGELEERIHARDQVDAGRDHRRGVDQGRDRRRALHRVREPGVERELGGLRKRADQDQQADRDDRPLVRA